MYFKHLHVRVSTTIFPREHKTHRSKGIFQEIKCGKNTEKLVDFVAFSLVV